ncbi:MAG: methyltransferase domain-containing protein [Candidatus Cloacimonetes bacterium]|nr:methyltransferase domain-containing protein [Candidatus Cloacimonadota bacterium]
MNLKEYTEKNRIAWNAVMPYHQKAKKDEWDKNFRQPGYIIQEEPELSKLRELGLEGKKVIHLCCNNGRELLSLKNMGARYCLGVDISDAAIQGAVDRAKACNIDVEYLRSDVYDLGDEYNGSFDLVYMTIGGLVWLPDIRRFFAVVNRLLKPGGQFFIYDSHPFSNLMPWEGDAETKVEITQPYFHSEAWEWSDSLDYYGGAEYEAPVHYEFTYTLSEILMALIDNQIEIRFMGEYEKDISCGMEWLEQRSMKLPLSYILIGQKQKDNTDENRTNKTGRSTNCKI